MKLAVVFIFAFVFGKIFSCKDSITDDKIINGKKIKISEVPYHVGWYINGIYQCGGSIISQNFVLTSAHCTRKLRLLPYYEVTVRTASHLKYEGGFLYKAKKVIVHPEYTDFPSWKQWDHDVALIELEEPLCYSNISKSINMTDVEPSAGELLQVTGWGDTEEGIDSNELLAAEIPVMDWSTCKKIAEEGNMPKVTHRTICGNGTHAGGCNGDSGSPVTLNGKQVGIVTGGSRDCNFINAWTNIANEEIMTFIRRNSNIGSDKDGDFSRWRDLIF